MLRFHSLRVVQVSADADDAVCICLEGPAELREVFSGLPGQHVVVRARIEGEEVRRTYSLLNAPGEWPLRIAVRVHRDGTMSRYLAEKICVGESLDVMPPNGSLTPHALSQDSGTSVAFAAGCGITPVLNIVRAVLAANSRNRFILFYGNTSTGRTMCLEELLALKDRYLERLSLHFMMSREPQEFDVYNGRLDADKVNWAARSVFAPAGVTEYFVCGPGKMNQEVTATLRALGVPVDAIHGEHFYVEAEKEATEHPAPIAAPSDHAEVTITMDGRTRTFSMRMNDESVLDAAARAGLELPFSCRAGVCSTCRTKVVRGEVEMQQNYALEDSELQEGYILACQSRVMTPILELDYDEK